MFLKHIFRSIKSKPLQPIMIVTVIMLSVAVMIASVFLPIGIYRNSRASYETDEWTPDFSVNPKSSSKMRFLFVDDVTEALGDRGRAIGEFGFSAFLDQARDENGERIRLRIAGVDLLEADSFYEIRYLAYGKFTDKNLKTSTIISESFAEENKVGIGDDITLNVLGYKLTYTVQAIAKATGIFREKECLVDIQSVRSALAERSAVIASLSDDFIPYTSIRVQLNDESAAESIKAELEALDYFKDKSIVLKDKGTEGDFLSTILTLTIVIPAVLLLIISCVLMVSSFELLQKKRLADIALFKIVGADERHINSIMYLESALYGTLGGLLGCALAYPMMLWLNRVYSFKFVALSLGVAEISVGFGSAVAFTLFSTALHIRKQKRKGLQKELAQGNYDTDKKLSFTKLLYCGIPLLILLAVMLILPPIYRYIPALLFVFVFAVFLYMTVPYVIGTMARFASWILIRCKRGQGDLILASRACENSYPLKHAGRMMALFITIFTSMMIALSAVHTQLDSYVGFARFEYVAMWCDEVTKDMISELDGIESTAQSVISRNVAFEGVTTTTGVGIVGDIEGCFDSSLLPKQMPKDNEIALSKGVAKMLGLKVGDEVTCTISDREYTFVLSEIVGAYADFAYYDLEYIEGNGDMFCIRTDGRQETTESLFALLDERGIFYMEKDEFFASTYEKLNPQFKAFGAMMYIIIFMTVLGILNILGEQRLARAAEFDVLKQNGKTKLGIVKLQTVEVAYLLISAAIVSVIGSAILCFALNRVAISFGMTMFV